MKMTQKERELRQKMEAKNKEIRALLDENKLDEAETLTNELRALKQQLDIEVTLNDTSLDNVPPQARSIGEQDEKVDSETLMMKAIRRLDLNDEERKVVDAARRDLSSTTNGGADGGFIIPQDIQTRINELKRALDPLETLVNVENVSTLTGARTYEKLATMKPFAAVGENEAISNTDSPKFARVEYAIKKYAGILPIPNELLADTDQNLMAYVLNWLSKKDVVTRNGKIIEVFKTLTSLPVANLDAVKDVLNVTLDPMIALTANVVTNQDGFNFLDKQKDQDGKYLLQVNPLNPTEKMLFGKVVKVVSNNYLPSDKAAGTKAPIIIGNLKETMTLFDRQALSLKGTDVGGDAFKNDRYDLRAITRFDLQKTDDKAAVYGQLTIA